MTMKPTAVTQHRGAIASLRILGALAAALALLFIPGGCDDAREEIDLTMADLDSAAQRRDGEGFARLLAPESFQHYDRLRKIALDGTVEQIHRLPHSEKLDVVMMRNRSTRKELGAMDGRAWVVHVVRQGWIDGVSPPEELVSKKNVRVTANSATLEIVYNVRQPLFTGEGSLEKYSDTIAFQKVDDRWLADARRPSVLFERIIELERQISHRSPFQIIEAMEAEDSGKKVAHDIWSKPMR